MAGTVEGGKEAARKNIALYGKDYYARIGAKGGKNGKTGGFYADRENARKAGKKGGRRRVELHGAPVYSRFPDKKPTT